MKQNQIPQSIEQIPEVVLHPQTVKHLKKGHPWITQDNFSDKFPDDFLIKYSKNNNSSIFINDKNHKKVKARLWANVKSTSKLNCFENDIEFRLKMAIEKRKKKFRRDNFYLCFGEADLLPGLFIQQLGKNILIQTQCKFWENFQENIINIIKNTILDMDNFWWQDRSTKKSFPHLVKNNQKITGNEHYVIKEFGVKLAIFLGASYDHGIYTDMAAIRNKLIPLIRGQSLLNLYCYTGIFSLHALQQGFTKVKSVDISHKYLTQLEENILLNNFDLNNHESIEGDSLSVLQKIIKDNQKFDFVICDPPTASSDGKKLTNTFEVYPTLLSKIYKTLNHNGLALLALNTHQIGIKKFEEMIIKNSPKDIQVIERFKLSDDCPTLPYFPEGNYLKVILIKKNS